MIRNLLAITLASVLAVSAASASEVDSTAVFRVTSDLVYRGVELNPSNVSVGLGVEFDNVVADGVYVVGNFDTVEVTPLNDNTTVRSDLEVGYGASVGDFGYTVGLARVINPVSYSEDYTELRARLACGYVYGEVGYGISSDVNQDAYVGVGVEGELFVPNLTLGALASVVNYDTNGNSGAEFNNFQVYASYPVWRELELNAGFSVGGQTDVVDLDNHAWVGASYTF